MSEDVTGPANESEEDPGQSLDEHQMVDRFARELYAIRYAPVPTSPSNVNVYHSAMEIRRGQWDTGVGVPKHIWHALAADMLDVIFGDKPPDRSLDEEDQFDD